MGHAIDRAGARLDNDVQSRRAGPILSASVAFVALSGEAEYAYGWRSASAATFEFARLLKPPPLRRAEDLGRQGVDERFL